MTAPTLPQVHTRSCPTCGATTSPIRIGCEEHPAVGDDGYGAESGGWDAEMVARWQAINTTTTATTSTKAPA